MLGTICDCKYKYFLVGRALLFWQSDEEVSLRDACLICAEDMCQLHLPHRYYQTVTLAKPCMLPKI